MSLFDHLRGLLGRRKEPSRSDSSAAHEAAVEVNEAGNEASAAGRREEACRLYLEAIRLDPAWSSPWFNLGLEHKRLRRWRESLEASRRALELAPGKGPAAWNLGIAATALGDWPEARRAWSAYEIELPAGDGPIEMKLGPVPIRVSPEEAAEVVWCRRIDPARAIIESVPLPESGRCTGDVVLHDGAPNGHRMLGNREVPVFDELELLEPSRSSTWSAEIACEGPEDAAALLELLDRRGLTGEDWTREIEVLCKACSEGRPHAAGEGHGRHHAAEAEAWDRPHRFGIASEHEGPIREALAAWTAGGDGRACLRLELALHGGRRR